MSGAFVYILTNKQNGTLYTGVTSNLIRRIFQHKNNLTAKKAFSRKHRTKQLVYYEQGGSIFSAISREKEIKNRGREFKLNLIESMNPKWLDLYDCIIGTCKHLKPELCPR